MAQLTNIFGSTFGYFPGNVANGTYTIRTDTPGDGSKKSLSLVGTSSSVEVTWTSSSTYALDKTHTYYFAAKVYFPDTVNGSFDFYWPIAEPVALSGLTVSEAKTWKRISGVFTRTSFTSGAQACRFDYNNQSGTVAAYVSGMTLVDLTAAFGSGNEPSKDWCDTVLPYIDSSGFYSTLTELFDATADSIRALYQSSDKVYPSQFPDLIQQRATQAESLLCDKYSVSIPAAAVTLPTAFTPSCFYYYGGYYWVGGSNSAGEGIVCYTEDITGNWTTANIRSGRAFPIHALAFCLDDDRVIALCDPNGYNGACAIRMENFFSYSGYYTTWTNNKTYTDAVTIDGTGWVMMGTTTTGKTYGEGLFNHTTQSSLTRGYYRCCVYNSYPIGISYDGYYTYKSSMAETDVVGEYQIAASFTSKVVAQLGDYLVVAGTKSDGTYLYYAKGTPGSLSFTGRKIMTKAVTPIGLMYANGLYVMAYTDGSNLRFWAAESLTDSYNNVSGIKVGSLDGMTGVGVLGNGTELLAVADNSGKAVVASYTAS